MPLHSQHLERDSIIELLAHSGRCSHGVFGCFRRPGHDLYETTGPDEAIRKYADDSERGYSRLFADET